MTLLGAQPSVATPGGAAPRPRNRYLAGFLSARGITGAALLILILLAGFMVPLFLPYGPLQQSAAALAPPGTGGHLLGTDEFGRDILARVLSGIRVDAFLAVVALPIAAVGGTALGMLSGLNRIAGGLVQRLFDILLGFPGVVMGVAVGIAMSPGQSAVIVTIVLIAMPAFGRQARLTTQSQLQRDYVSAAIVAGTPRWQIIIRHVLPNVADTVLVRAAVAVAHAIQVEGALSVVGLGIQPPQASLGVMISSGAPYLSSSPLYSLAPVAVVFVLILGCTVLADALNKAVLRR
jgi:peptide/nickel transport system permease protein